MTDCDLAIVGAGFAGLACAQAAAARGVRTVVIDRKPTAGAACHTTGLLVKEVADAWDFPRAHTRTIHGVRLYSPALRTLDLHRPGYFFLATDTPHILEWLAETARHAGADVRFNTSYQGAVRDSTSSVSRLALAEVGLRCQYLVGADGPRSRVARDFALGENRTFLTGVEIEVTGIRGVDEEMLHVFVDRDIAPGYIAWMIPGVHAMQIGLAARGAIAGRLDGFLAQLAKRFDFSQAQIVGRRGGLIPCGGVVRRWSTPQMMLVGDAAGMVSPLTAGGIHPAMQLGRLAGVAIANHLQDAAADPARAVAASCPTFFWKRWMRAGFDALPTNGLVELAFRSSLFRSAAQTIFFHNRGIFSLEAWRDLLFAVR